MRPELSKKVRSRKIRLEVPSMQTVLKFVSLDGITNSEDKQ